MTTISRLDRTPGIIFGLLLLGSAVLYSLGQTGDLPYEPYVDEPIFVAPAVRIAATGNPNPRWFGNPGSTVIYPLAATYHVWGSVEYGESLFQVHRDTATRFETDPTPFYMLGRMLNVAYALLTLCVLFAFASSAFGSLVALMSVAFFVMNAMTLYYVHMVRTDIAATFWGMLSLALLVRLFDRPSMRGQILAGGAIGLSVATRYFMGVLIPVLLFVDLLLVRANRERLRSRTWWREVGAGVVAVAALFAISTPYFFIHLPAALRDIAREARSTHLGADGLSPLGNIAFYLTDAVNASVGIPESLLAVAGSALLVARRRTHLYVLPVVVVTFLVGISMQKLHWDRWIIPAFPILAMLTAYGLHEIVVWICGRMRITGRSIRLSVAVVALSLVLAVPLLQSAWYTYRAIHPSTRLTARDWVVDNLPQGSKIVAEAYTAPHLAPDYEVLEPGAAFTDFSVGEYAKAGYEYIMVSSNIYQRYYNEANRYPEQVAFFDDLFQHYRLIQSIDPNLSTAGPSIRIYSLDQEQPR